MQRGFTVLVAIVTSLTWAATASADEPAAAAPAAAPVAAPPTAAAPAPAPTMMVVQAAPPAPAAVVVDCCAEPPCCHPGLHATAGAIYAKIRRSDTVYASLDDDGVPPFGSTRDAPEVNFDYELGFRAGLSWTSCGACCWDFGVNATFLSADADDSFTAPIAFPVGVSIAIGATSGTSTLEEDYLAIDADAGYTFCEKCFSARLYGGLRFLKIDEDNHRAYNAAPNTLLVDNSTEMTAFGLHVGIEPRFRLARGLSVWGRFGGGILMGSFDWTHDESVGVVGGPVQALSSARKSVDQDITMIEAGLGLSWETNHLFGGCLAMRVNAGYELTRYDFLDFSAGAGVVPFPTVDVQDSSYSVDGFFLTVEFLF